jgi:transmembrane 9 superfamily protein 2/4
MAWQQVLALLLLVGCSAQVAQSFYLPGVAPQDFKKGDAIYLKVNKVCLASSHALP